MSAEARLHLIESLWDSLVQIDLRPTTARLKYRLALLQLYRSQIPAGYFAITFRSLSACVAALAAQYKAYQVRLGVLGLSEADISSAIPEA